MDALSLYRGPAAMLTLDAFDPQALAVDICERAWQEQQERIMLAAPVRLRLDGPRGRRGRTGSPRRHGRGHAGPTATPAAGSDGEQNHAGHDGAQDAD